MSKHEKPSFKHLAAGILLGAAVILALSTLLTLFLALPVASGTIGEGAEGDIVVVCAFASAALGALAARLKNRGAALLSGAGSALLAVLLRLLLGFLTEGPHGLDGTDTAVCLAILCGGIAAGAVTLGRGRRRRQRRSY